MFIIPSRALASFSPKKNCRNNICEWRPAFNKKSPSTYHHSTAAKFCRGWNQPVVAFTNTRKDYVLSHIGGFLLALLSGLHHRVHSRHASMPWINKMIKSRRTEYIIQFWIMFLYFHCWNMLKLRSATPHFHRMSAWSCCHEVNHSEAKRHPHHPKLHCKHRWLPRGWALGCWSCSPPLGWRWSPATVLGGQVGAMNGYNHGDNPHRLAMVGDTPYDYGFVTTYSWNCYHKYPTPFCCCQCFEVELNVVAETIDVDWFTMLGKLHYTKLPPPVFQTGSKAASILISQKLDPSWPLRSFPKNGFKFVKWVHLRPFLEPLPNMPRHKEPRLLGTCDQQLLREGHAVQAQLHAQVAPGHHEGLGLGDDAIDVGQGLPAQLGTYQVWVKDGQKLPGKPDHVKKVMFIYPNQSSAWAPQEWPKVYYPTASWHMENPPL